MKGQHLGAVVLSEDRTVRVEAVGKEAFKVLDEGLMEELVGCEIDGRADQVGTKLLGIE